MAGDWRVVEIKPDKESGKALQSLARAADEGEIVGAIVIAFHPRRKPGKRYFMSLSGIAAADPTYAAGAMSACQTLLQDLALEDAGLL